MIVLANIRSYVSSDLFSQVKDLYARDFMSVEIIENCWYEHNWLPQLELIITK